MRRVPVRIQVDVGQPFAPDLAADLRLGQQRAVALDVLAERAVTARVEHVARRQLLQIVRHLRAVGIGHRVQNDVHTFEHLAV